MYDALFTKKSHQTNSGDFSLPRPCKNSYNTYMSIQWNHVTWYSKLGALILFIIVVPAITFIIGKEYQKTIDVLEQSELSDFKETKEVWNQSNNASVAPVDSGISGTVIKKECKSVDPKVCNNLATPLIVKTIKGKTVTHTVSRNDGKFLLLLPPDTYQISSMKNKSAATNVTVEAQRIVPAEFPILE